METRKHVVVLAAGDFPTAPEPLRALDAADFVVCCDSAFTAFASSPFAGKPFVVVGDGDSLPSVQREQLGTRYVHIAEQDYNDLHKAMHWAVAHFGQHGVCYTILGATGQREDHTIGNISYLVTFAEELPAAEVRMLTDYGSLVAVHGRLTLPTRAGQQVSIFCLTPQQPVSATGLKWPLEEMSVRLWWQATLNQALGSSVTISTEGWAVAYLLNEVKQQ